VFFLNTGRLVTQRVNELHEAIRTLQCSITIKHVVVPVLKLTVFAEYNS